MNKKMNKQMISMVSLLFLLFTLIQPMASYADGSPLDAFEGTYRGWYYANQGHTGLTLKVVKDRLTDNLEATFNFYSVPENPSVPSGEYKCKVYYNSQTNKYFVQGTQWVNKPANYGFVDLDGVLNGNVYSGEVLTVSGKKFSFEVVKQTGDNATSTWAESSIDKAILDSYVPLELQGKYQDPITRAEFTRLAVAAISLKSNMDIQAFIQAKGITLQQQPFTDTTDSFVNYGSSLEIVNGYGNEKFGPNDLITREQSAMMLMNLAAVFNVKPTGQSIQNFSDRSTYSWWALDGIAFITNYKVVGTDATVMTGFENKFNPKGSYTKEQAIVTIYNLVRSLK